MLEGYGGATTQSPTDAWFDALDPFESLGVTAYGVVSGAVADMPGLARSTGPGGTPMAGEPLWSPKNPLFVFGALLAATTGLVAFSTSFRVGKGVASVSVGKA